MNSVFPRALMPIVYLSIQCCSATPQTPTHVNSERSAAMLAEEAFLKTTKHEVTEYSVRPCRHTSTEWCFFFQGERQFLGPGNHWLVTVDRATGNVKVDEGL